jgi:hypothetical protein
MKYLLYQNQTSVRPFATLIIDSSEYDEEIEWIAEILGCDHVEREDYSCIFAAAK